MVVPEYSLAGVPLIPDPEIRQAALDRLADPAVWESAADAVFDALPARTRPAWRVAAGARMPGVRTMLAVPHTPTHPFPCFLGRTGCYIKAAAAALGEPIQLIPASDPRAMVQSALRAIPVLDWIWADTTAAWVHVPHGAVDRVIGRRGVHVRLLSALTGVWLVAVPVAPVAAVS